MVRNRNGFWMSPKFYMSPDDGGGTGGAEGAPAGNEPGAGAGGETPPAGNDGDGKGSGEKSLAEQLEQAKAEAARMKAALDKATHEASENKKALNESQKALKAKMTQEEIDAANKKEAEEKQAARLQELEREVARVKSTKSVMAKLNVDEESAGKIAECLVGCEDVDNALLLIQKAWDAREKALRLEFGKIPGPGAGGSNEEDAEEKAAIAIAKQIGRNRAEADKSVADGLKGYIR